MLQEVCLGITPLGSSGTVLPLEINMNLRTGGNSQIILFISVFDISLRNLKINFSNT